jgi:hypothetical protein
MKTIKKVNIIIAYFRLLFKFCPQCNSDAPKKDICKVCNNGQYKSRKDLKFRFEMFDLLNLPDKDKKILTDSFDWILRMNNIESNPIQEILKSK